MATWMLVMSFVLQIGMLIWGLFFVVLARRELAWWKRLGDLFYKVPAFMQDAVHYHLKGMPRNAQACKKSTDQTLSEIDQMTRDRRSQNP